MNRDRIQRMAQTALLGSLALLLSYIETMIPLPFAVPGIKLGLANAAILVALFSIDVRSAVAVATIKVLASGFLFGSPMMLAYSATGTLLALLSMILLCKVFKLGAVPVSMASAICHNIGQLLAAAVMLSSSAVFLTLPLLAVAACVTGAVIGFVAQGVIDALRIEKPRRREVDLSALELKAGECIAFVGPNGSGKTTAVLQLAGLTEGDDCGAKITFQDPDDQIVNQRVEDDVAFGCENMGIELSEMRRLVASALSDLNIDELAQSDVAKLSGGQKQQVAIAGVLAMTPHLVAFDEATSMQDAAGRERFYKLVSRLKERGVAVVIVTQLPREAVFADRVAVFSDCCLVEVVSGVEYAHRMTAKTPSGLASVQKPCQVGTNFDRDGVDDENRLQTRRSESCVFSTYQQDAELVPTWHGFSQGETSQHSNCGQNRALRLEDIEYRYQHSEEDALRGASLSVEPGCVVGLSGPSGSGKSTLAQIAAGYLNLNAGQVILDGEAMEPDREGKRLFRSNVAYVAQTPEKALFATTAFEDVMFGGLNRGLDEEVAQTLAEKALSAVGIDPNEARRKSPFAYSGGEKRRLALAGMLVLETPYLILDEPNAGLDPAEVARLATLIRWLAASGRGILLISHDEEFLESCCDTCAMMQDGRVREGILPRIGDMGFEDGDTLHCNDDARFEDACPNKPSKKKALKRNAAFGVYCPGDSLMHRLTPQMKLVACAIFIVAGFIAKNWLALGLSFLFALGMLAAAKTSPRQALRSLRPFVFLMIFVGVFDALFVCSGDIWWQAGPLSLSSGGLAFAAESVVRFALVALGTSTLMRTTSATELADACSSLLKPVSRLGFHVDDLALSLSMTLRFIPLVQSEFFDVKRAQEARLASFNAPNLLARAKAYVPVLTPLFNGCLRRSATLALAIENRGYKTVGNRTHFREYRVRPADVAALFLVVLLLVACIAL